MRGGIIRNLGERDQNPLRTKMHICRKRVLIILRGAGFITGIGDIIIIIIIISIFQYDRSEIIFGDIWR